MHTGGGRAPASETKDEIEKKKKKKREREREREKEKPATNMTDIEAISRAIYTSHERSGEKKTDEGGKREPRARKLDPMEE